MPSFTGSEFNNRQAWATMPKTGDMRALDQNYRRSKAAHDALMRAQAMEAEQDNAILSTATPDEMANLFGTPRTEREARLQRIVQNDSNAKIRGTYLIPDEKQKIDYQQRLAGLDNSYLQNASARLNLQQDPIAFDLQQRLGGLQLRSGEANMLHASNADARGEHADTRADARLEIEDQRFTLAQQKADAQENRFNQRMAFNDFMAAHTAVKNGQVSAEEIIAANHSLSPAQQMTLRGLDEGFNTQAKQARSFAAAQNAGLTNFPMPEAIPAKPAWFGNRWGLGSAPAMEPSPEAIAFAKQQALIAQGKNVQARPFTEYDAATGRFVPQVKFQQERPTFLRQYGLPVDNSVFDAGTSGGGYLERQDGSSYSPLSDDPMLRFGTYGPPPPQASAPMPSMRPQPNQGGQLLEGPDGYLYRIVNGQPQRTNLRRR